MKYGPIAPNIKRDEHFVSAIPSSLFEDMFTTRSAIRVEFYSNQILTILCEIDDLELLYSIDLLDYNKKKGTPIGDHIDRVGQIFYEAA